MLPEVGAAKDAPIGQHPAQPHHAEAWLKADIEACNAHTTRFAMTPVVTASQRHRSVFA